MTTAGTSYVKDLELEVDIDDTAPTETVTILCEDNRISGMERWSVKGTDSKVLPDAVSGVEYDSGGYSFTIPQIVNLADAGLGRISVKYHRPNYSGQEALPKFKAIRAVS